MHLLAVLPRLVTSLLLELVMNPWRLQGLNLIAIANHLVEATFAPEPFIGVASCVTASSTEAFGHATQLLAAARPCTESTFPFRQYLLQAPTFAIEHRLYPSARHLRFYCWHYRCEL